MISIEKAYRKFETGGGLVEFLFRRDFRRLATISDLPFTRIWRKFHTASSVTLRRDNLWATNQFPRVVMVPFKTVTMASRVEPALALHRARYLGGVVVGPNDGVPG